MPLLERLFVLFAERLQHTMGWCTLAVTTRPGPMACRRATPHYFFSNQLARLLALTTVLGLLTGCSADPFPIAPVSGVVTLGGEPLAEARINFEPKAKPGSELAGPGSFGMTDSSGHFELETIDRRPGAVVGTHRVEITTEKWEMTADGGSRNVRREILPARYHSNTELSFDVPADGTTTADFALEKKKKSRR